MHEHEKRLSEALFEGLVMAPLAAFILSAMVALPLSLPILFLVDGRSLLAWMFLWPVPIATVLLTLWGVPDLYRSIGHRRVVLDLDHGQVEFEEHRLGEHEKLVWPLSSLWLIRAHSGLRPSGEDEPAYRDLELLLQIKAREFGLIRSGVFPVFVFSEPCRSECANAVVARSDAMIEMFLDCTKVSFWDHLEEPYLSASSFKGASSDFVGGHQVLSRT